MSRRKTKEDISGVERQREGESREGRTIEKVDTFGQARKGITRKGIKHLNDRMRKQLRFQELNLIRGK